MENIKIIFCIMTLLVILQVGRKISFKGIVAPQTLNALAFVPSLFLLLFYTKSWNVDLSPLTITLIIIQPLIFTTISIFFNKLSISKNTISNNTTYSRLEKIRTPNILVFTFLEIVSLVLLIRYEISIVGSFNNLATLLFKFRYASSTGDGVDLPGLVSILRLLTIYSGFIWMYLLTINILKKKKKNNNLYILNLTLSFLSSLALGSRGDAVMLIAVGVVQFLYLLYRKIYYSNYELATKKRNRKKLKKYIWLVFFVGILIATQFDTLANIMGRDTSDFTGMSYLALYLSAPIKNLDSFLRDGCMGFAPNFGSSKTLALLIAYIGPKYFGYIPQYVKFEYTYINDIFMGNVYTAYANFYYDYGIISFLLFSVIMAVLTNYFYSKSLQQFEQYSKDINISLIIYSLMAFGIIFNFFANEYYNTVFNIGFFRGVIILYFIRWFLLKVRITSK